MSKVHVIGGGLAGLAATVSLTGNGVAVDLHEGSGQAGGRCRSFFDKTLNCNIDNGNHLFLSGNKATLSFLERIGSIDSIHRPERAVFPFQDIRSGRRWSVAPSGLLPLWVLSKSTRVPDTRLRDYLGAIRLAFADANATVADAVGTEGALYERFWEPLCVAVLNCSPTVGSAQLLWAVMAETFARGENSCRPLISAEGLGASFIEPALAYLEPRPGSVTFNRSLRRMAFEGQAVSALDFGDMEIPVAREDIVVLALPSNRAAALVPGLEVPGDGETIVNAHLRMPEPVKPPGGIPILGIIGGLAQWIFLRGNIISVTISAATQTSERSASDLEDIIWKDVAHALGLPMEPRPPMRVIKERRATFDQSPRGVAMRPSADTKFHNLILAGDWTDTGLPATIEGAIRSGNMASQRVLARLPVE